MLTPAQSKALRLAVANGVVTAGYNDSNGSRYTVAYPALAALIRRGLLIQCFGPEGGAAGRPTDKGRAALLTEARVMTTHGVGTGRRSDKSLA